MGLLGTPHPCLLLLGPAALLPVLAPACLLLLLLLLLCSHRGPDGSCHFSVLFFPPASSAALLGSATAGPARAALAAVPVQLLVVLATDDPLVPAREPRRVAELQVDLAVLAGLGAAPAVAGRPVGLEVDLGAERVRELLGAAAALLAQEVLLSEVLTQVLVVAAGDGVSAGACAQPAGHPGSLPTPTCSSPGPRLSHRSGRSSGRGAGA